MLSNISLASGGYSRARCLLHEPEASTALHQEEDED